MTILAPIALKVTLIFGAAWLTAVLLRKSSAAVRHQVWAAAILCSLALPLLIWAMPQWGSTDFMARPTINRAVPFAASPIVETVKAPRPAPQNAPRNVGRILLWIGLWAWAAGAAVMLLRLIIGLAQLFWAGSRARPLFADGSFRKAAEIAASLGRPPSVRLLASQSPLAMPLTWGLLRPRILLPSNAMEWTDERLRVVLAHELAHVVRRDWILRICGELACAIYWFHPLAWLAVMSLREESERACDDAVLGCGVSASDYASQLLTLARTLDKPARAWSAALGMARPSNFERRVIAMLNPSMNRRRPSAGARILTAVASLCVLVPLAGLRAPGQGLAGTFSGTVLDPTGAVVPNVTVTLTNNATNPPTKETAISNPAGKFLFTNLPAGQYELKAMAPGFSADTAKQVTLDPGRDSTANINLRVGQVREHVTVTAPGTPRTPQFDPSKPIRVGGMVQPPRLISRVSPVYPQSAQAAGIEGTVELEAVIGKDGSVVSLQNLSSFADADLLAAAKDAVSQWRYSPTKLNGEPVETITQISVQFTLSQ